MLSRDGQWLTYALTAQGLDGQLVVRNLQTGQELKHRTNSRGSRSAARGSQAIQSTIAGLSSEWFSSREPRAASHE
jgi:hypothetical protein